MIQPTVRAALAAAVVVAAAIGQAGPAPASRSAGAPPRNWGPEQATGKPDTPEPGDHATAWASAGQDDEDEWLVLRYERPVIPIGVRVFESYNPGALIRVTLLTADGKEVEVWKGTDPTTPDQKSGVSKITFQTNLKVDRIKLYLDSKGVAGWNEIDAVALDDPTGKAHWAVEAWASSTYAERVDAAPGAAVPGGPVPARLPVMVRPPVPAVPLPALPMPQAAPVSRPADEKRVLEDRVRRLEAEIAQLKKTLRELEELVRAQRR